METIPFQAINKHEYLSLAHTKIIFSNTYSFLITIYYRSLTMQSDREPSKQLLYSVKTFQTFFDRGIKSQKWLQILAKVYQFKESPTIWGKISSTLLPFATVPNIFFDILLYLSINSNAGYPDHVSFGGSYIQYIMYQLCICGC